MTTTAQVTASILRGLNTEDRTALKQTIEYLGEAASRPDGWTPEGSVASVLNKQSPAVRKAVATISNAMETPRFMPFQPKLSERERAEEFGLDPDDATTIKAAMDAQEVATALQDRMGTTVPDSEPTTRDVIAAAMEQHHG